MAKLIHNSAFEEHDQENWYWTDGTNIFYRHYQIKGADIATFEHFYGIWAKDRKNCYSGSHRLNNSDPATFVALNLTYAKDKDNAWVLAGRIVGADAATFEACDDGKHSLGKIIKSIGSQKISCEMFVPYGFAKDKNNVYYYDFAGKPKVVRKADPKMFKSLNDGHFAFDDQYVFCGSCTLPKANPKTWQKLKESYYYSLDRKNIFYFNRPIKDADTNTFEIVEIPGTSGNPTQLAKDKNTAYWTDRSITFEELKEETERQIEFYNKIKI